MYIVVIGFDFGIYLIFLLLLQSVSLVKQVPLITIAFILIASY